MKKRKLKFAWTCSDFSHHQHRWKWIAWLCGRWQYFSFGDRKDLAQAHLDLLTENEQLRADNERFREALDKYGQHRSNCAGYKFKSDAHTFDENAFKDCDCGLDRCWPYLSKASLSRSLSARSCFDLSLSGAIAIAISHSASSFV